MQFGGSGSTSGRQGQWFLRTEPRIACCVITQPPYSPDFAPSDFSLFPALKMGLTGTRFATMDDIKSNATAKLRKIPKEPIRRCFEKWQDRWRKCVCVCVFSCFSFLKVI
jgi:hypothetical protein